MHSLEYAPHIFCPARNVAGLTSMGLRLFLRESLLFFYLDNVSNIWVDQSMARPSIFRHPSGDARGIALTTNTFQKRDRYLPELNLPVPCVFGGCPPLPELHRILQRHRGIVCWDHQRKRVSGSLCSLQTLRDVGCC